jgi:hypothetical protein
MINDTVTRATCATASGGGSPDGGGTATGDTTANKPGATGRTAS